MVRISTSCFALALSTAVLAHDVTLHKIVGRASDPHCGEVTLDEKDSTYAISVEGFTEGRCATLGYTEKDIGYQGFEETPNIRIPFKGAVALTTYRRSGLRAAALKAEAFLSQLVARPMQQPPRAVEPMPKNKDSELTAEQMLESARMTAEQMLDLEFGKDLEFAPGDAETNGQGHPSQLPQLQSSSITDPKAEAAKIMSRWKARPEPPVPEEPEDPNKLTDEEWEGWRQWTKNPAGDNGITRATWLAGLGSVLAFDRRRDIANAVLLKPGNCCSLALGKTRCYDIPQECCTVKGKASDQGGRADDIANCMIAGGKGFQGQEKYYNVGLAFAWEVSKDMQEMYWHWEGPTSTDVIV